MLTILVFAPHSGIWVHAFPEALVAECLRSKGHRLVYIGCGRALEKFCVCMSAAGLHENSAAARKRAVCGACEARKTLLRREFGFEGYDLSQMLTAEDMRYADERASSATPDTVLSLEEDGVPIGRYALYEFLLNRKKTSLHFDDAEWSALQPHLRNAFLALRGGKRILQRERPDRVIFYNSLYSVNRVVARLAEASGATTYFLHAGGNLSNRLQTLMIGRQHTFHYYEQLVARWPEWEHVACAGEVMRRVTDHFMVLFGSESVFSYSSPARGTRAGARQKLGIAPGRKILVAAMSSYDEQFAGDVTGARPIARSLLFPRQVDWFRSLVRYVEARQDLFLVIRVHPREFPNKREGVKSEHAAELESALAGIPPNVRVNWPRDGISVYDLAGEASVFLTGWSNVGKEMTLLGLPVVTYCPEILLYPPSLHEAGATLPDYYAAVERALAAGWSIERARHAYRWYALEHHHGLFDISDAFAYRENVGLGTRVQRRLGRMLGSIHEEQRDCAARPRRLNEVDSIAQLIESGGQTRLDIARRGRDDISVEEETAFLKRELARIRDAMFGSAPGRVRAGLCARLDEATSAEAPHHT